jgi:dTDP-4-amino-4,6-dideoxygalactose transaminase
MIGSRATLSCWSFYPTKNLGAMGDGGMVTTSDSQLAARIASLRSHGMTSDHRHNEVGINSRLDALQAALLRVKLRHLEGWTKARGENAAHYDRAFGELGAVASGCDFAHDRLCIAIPAPVASPGRHVYHHYVVRVPAARRDALATDLRARGIETAVYYPVGLHQQPALATPVQARGTLAATEAVARESLALPVHPGLSATARTKVVDEVVDLLSALGPLSARCDR